MTIYVDLAIRPRHSAQAALAPAECGDDRLPMLANSHRIALWRRRCVAVVNRPLNRYRRPGARTLHPAGEHPPMPSPKTLLLALLLAFTALSGVAAVDAIDINRASADQLTALPGIGDRKAEAIVRYRETNGEFETVDQLIHVKGIGIKLLTGIRDQVAVE